MNRTRRRFLEDVGSGILVAGLGVALADDLGLGTAVAADTGGYVEACRMLKVDS